MHRYLYKVIKDDPYIQFRKDLASVLGCKVIAPLIKNKKYRKDLTDFLDQLRLSSNFRDRQMYVVIAEATYDGDADTYKKHFAKAISSEMKDEKVVVVQMLLAKLCAKVPKGYSKSTDALAESLLKAGNREVIQFLSNDNECLNSRRFLDPSKFKVKLKDDNDSESKVLGTIEESKQGGTHKPNLDEESREIASFEKSVNIRFCNYTMLIRATQFSLPGLSAQLLALLGGYTSLLTGATAAKGLVDATEEKMLKQ